LSSYFWIKLYWSRNQALTVVTRYTYHSIVLLCNATYLAWAFRSVERTRLTFIHTDIKYEFVFRSSYCKNTTS